jgi:ribosomal protein S18 acetylase RimI-like enzyme
VAPCLASVSDSPEGLAGLLTADPQALLVAELDGVLAGSLIAAWDGWRGSFYRLAVSPEHRRKGLATMLLREGERRLREAGRRQARLCHPERLGELRDPRARASELHDLPAHLDWTPARH